MSMNMKTKRTIRPIQLGLTLAEHARGEFKMSYEFEEDSKICQILSNVTAWGSIKINIDFGYGLVADEEFDAAGLGHDTVQPGGPTVKAGTVVTFHVSYSGNRLRDTPEECLTHWVERGIPDPRTDEDLWNRFVEHAKASSVPDGEGEFPLTFVLLTEPLKGGE